MIRQELDLQLKTKLSLNLLLKNNVEILSYSTFEFEELLQEESISNPFVESFDVKVPKSVNFGEGVPDISAVPYTPDSLDRLKENITAEFEGKDIEIAMDLIYNTDEKGFISVDLKDISDQHGVSEEYVEKIRKRIMRLDPIGVCSKDVYEFLKVQIEELYPDRKEEYMKLLDKIVSGSINEKDRKLLKGFKMFPLEGGINSYKGGRVDAVIEVDDGNLVYFIYEDFFSIKIREDYLELYEKSTGEVKKFLKDMVERINVYNKILNLRREVLKSILEEIVNVQKDFLLGEGPLKGLLMKDVARKLEISESTLSRICNSKYVKTPVGTYPLRFFFVRNATEGVSQEELMRRIREIIENEDKRNPLSDEEIANILKREGMNTARRTVAKYRDMLGIPSSRERRIK